MRTVPNLFLFGDTAHYRFGKTLAWSGSHSCRCQNGQHTSSNRLTILRRVSPTDNSHSSSSKRLTPEGDQRLRPVSFSRWRGRMPEFTFGGAYVLSATDSFVKLKSGPFAINPGLHSHEWGPRIQVMQSPFNPRLVRCNRSSCNPLTRSLRTANGRGRMLKFIKVMHTPRAQWALSTPQKGVELPPTWAHHLQSGVPG